MQTTMLLFSRTTSECFISPFSSGLALPIFSEGNNEEALEIALEIQRHDPNQETLGRTLYYTVLLDMKRGLGGT